MKAKTTLALAGLLVVGMIGATGAAAQVTVIEDRTLSVNDDTESVRVLATNATGDVDVTFYSVADDGTETVQDTATLNTSTTDEVSEYEYLGVNASQFGEYRVVAESETTGWTIEISTVQVVQSGASSSLLKGESTDVQLFGAVVGALVITLIGVRSMSGSLSSVKNKVGSVRGDE